MTAVDSVESGLDTIVTTIRTENTIDTLFTRTDSLSGGKSFWFKVDTSVTLTSAVIDTVVIVLEGTEVVIEGKTATPKFTAYPNPVNLNSGEILFSLPADLSGSATVAIFDVVGTVLDEQTVYIREGSNISVGISRIEMAS